MADLGKWLTGAYAVPAEPCRAVDDEPERDERSVLRIRWPIRSRLPDNRTGKQYEVPIQDGTIKATDLRQIKVTPDEFGLMTYDPPS
jgi:hypothetical protein